MKHFAICIAFLTCAMQEAAAVTIQYYEIDPIRSYVTYPAAIEVVDAPDGAPLTIDYGLGAAIDITYLKYTPPGQLPLEGTLRIILGRDFANSLDIEPVDVAPEALPGGGGFDLALSSMTLRDGVFPHTSAPPRPPGSICACLTWTDPSAPDISGTLSDGKLIVDYRQNDLNLPVYPVFFDWVGEQPPQDFAGFNDPVALHLEATVVPLPAAAWVFISALGALGYLGNLRAVP